MLTVKTLFFNTKNIETTFVSILAPGIGTGGKEAARPVTYVDPARPMGQAGPGFWPVRAGRARAYPCLALLQDHQCDFSVTLVLCFDNNNNFFHG